MMLLRSLLVACLLLLSPLLNAQQKAFSIYLIGDAGEPYMSSTGLKQSLAAHHDASVPSAVVFLGDNVYPTGMPGVQAAGRARTEAIMEAQLQLLDGWDTKAYFIPGNHDWQQGKADGWHRIMQQQAWIDSLHREHVHFLPEGGCPGPVEVALSDRVTLIIMDSQWFLHPWDKPAGEESPCEVKFPQDAVVALRDALDRNRGKHVIVAAHHPIYTYGDHGGVFTWKDHLFPLLDLKKNLYIPMPVVGSIYPLYRQIIGDIQDTKHPIYKRYTGLVSTLLRDYPGTIYAAGHEHALQYAVRDGVHYVTSGSGAKTSYVKKKGFASYAEPRLGFVRVDILTNGTTTINYFANDASEPVYQVSLPAPAPPAARSESLPDFSKPVIVHASDQYRATPFREKMLGSNYRAEWKQDLVVPLFNIGEEAGGLKVMQRGGGMQTLSLRLADSVGREYTLRSVEKFPEKAVPEIFQKTFAQDLVQDQISAAHPYGALVVPPLAKAAGIYYTIPKLVYVPDDPRLGPYRRDFAHTLALFEERPDADASDKPNFGRAKKFLSTDKMLAKLAEDNDNKVDQPFVLRSRLFDMVIGDWDRHDDQWRWAVFKHKKKDTYRPIPRDRDQAFFLSDGLLASLWSRRWAMPKFEGFHDEIRWPSGFMFNARYFDRSFLNETTSQQWVEQANDLQRALTDASIDSAIRSFPPDIYKLHGEAIERKIKARRDRLPEYALEHYKFLAREVDVPGSNKREYFDVARMPNGDVNLQVYKINKSNERSDKMYERLFRVHETRELRLYGLGGDDVFNLSGNGPGRVMVRMVGGDGKDTVRNNSRTVGWGRSFRVYDERSGLAIQGRRDLADKTSDDPGINTYDRKAFRYPRLAPLIYGTFNYDDGVFIGGGFLYTTHGFRKQPYKSQHLFLASYALLTNSYNFKYDGRFRQVLGKWGIDLDLDLKAPNFVNNFFGWGNETEFNSDIDDDPAYEDALERSIDFYRVRLHQIELQALLARRIGSTGSIRIGPVYQRVKILRPDEDDPRFINAYAASIEPEKLFEDPQSFGGLRVDASIDKRDNPKLPARGVLLSHTSTIMRGLEGGSPNFTAHNATVSFYQTFRLPARLTFALRVGAGRNTGSYALYQAQILDGKTDLRGFRKTRFYGDSELFSNNEVRMKLASIRTYLFPASIGINGFYDIGRVWYKDASGKDPSTAGGASSVWHKGFGGGIWFTPFNLTVLSAELAHSKDGNMFYVRLGFLF